MNSTATTVPAEFSQAQQAEWARIVASLRRTIDHAVQLDAPLETLQRIGERAVELEAALAPVSGARPVPRFQLPLDAVNPNDFLPYSPVAGRFNPIAPPVQLSVHEGRLVAHVTLGAAYEGGVGFVHGGVIAMIWDQVLALANVLDGVGGPTGELVVRYRAPTPLGAELRFEAWHESRRGRKIVSRGRCSAGQVLLSEAEGTFIELDARARRNTGWGSHTQRRGTLPERRQQGEREP